jgi:hypothetical protein
VLPPSYFSALSTKNVNLKPKLFFLPTKFIFAFDRQTYERTISFDGITPRAVATKAGAKPTTVAVTTTTLVLW